MLRLQEEQNELLKKSLEKPQPAAAPRRAAAPAANDTSKFDSLREAERVSLETKDPSGFINMGDWWYQNKNFQEARTSYLLAVKVCYVNQLPPAPLCNRIAFTAQQLGSSEETRTWLEKGVEAGDQNCLNSLIWSYLIPEQKWADIDAHLEAARANDAGQTTTGVIANAAISLYKRGKPEEAIKLFKVALERPDKSANSEAFWWMSNLWREKRSCSVRGLLQVVPTSWRIHSANLGLSTW